jgi:hypothetical protein
MNSGASWRASPVDRRVVYSPVGFRLIDDLTGAAPLGAVRCALFIADAPNQFRLTDLQPVRSVSGILIFPGLGRTSAVAGQTPRHYRAVLAADFYRPFYAAQQDGVEFDAPPFYDDQPPPQPAGLAQDVVLVPATNYPFPPYLRVLRGTVNDVTGKVVVNAEVSRGNTERVLSDERGCFALPLRLEANNTAIVIDATDHRSGKQGQIQVTLPADLGKNQVITVN